MWQEMAARDAMPWMEQRKVVLSMEFRERKSGSEEEKNEEDDLF